MTPEADKIIGEIKKRGGTNRIVVSTKMYKGTQQVHVREQFIDPDTGEWKFKKNGISIGLSGAKDLKKAILEIDPTEPVTPTRVDNNKFIEYGTINRKPGERILVKRAWGKKVYKKDTLLLWTQFHADNKDWIFTKHRGIGILFEHLPELQSIFRRLEIPGEKGEE